MIPRNLICGLPSGDQLNVPKSKASMTANPKVNRAGVRAQIMAKKELHVASRKSLA